MQILQLEGQKQVWKMWAVCLMLSAGAARAPPASGRSLPLVPSWTGSSQCFPTRKAATETYLISVCKLLQAFVFEALY